LVNNAGFSQVGALIDLTREDFRNQFETNVIAPIMVVRAAIGLMQTASRQSGKPAVLANVGSIVGIASTPFAGAYCASKAAIHSLSDTLRMELAPLGIRVVTIQPGAVQSKFGANAEAKIRIPADSLYQSVSDKIHARARTIGEESATPAGKFACPVVDTLLADNPPSVIRGGKHSFALPLYKKLLPTATLDAKLSARFGLGDFSGN
jgi:NAD(P)-dependent dehydrogenase (short-subunit alcohol dehydrogenase family)